MSDGVIEVYCADTGHAPKEAKVALFIRAGSGWQIETQRLGRYSPRAVASVRQVHRRIGGDRLPVAPAVSESAPPAEGEHDKYELECNLCGSNLQRRAEVVRPLLDRLDDAGERARRVSLRLLDAMLP